MEILDVDVFQKFFKVLKLTTILAPEDGDNIECEMDSYRIRYWISQVSAEV